MSLPVEQREVRELVAGNATEELVTKAIAAMAPGSQVDGVQLTRTKFKPERKLRASYDVEIDGRNWPIVVTWFENSADRPVPNAAETADALAAVCDTPFAELHAFDAELDATIMVWPFDPAFPELASSLEQWGQSDATVSVVRYRPGERHVFKLKRDGSDTFEFVKFDRNGGADRIDTALDVIGTAVSNGTVDPSFLAMLVGPDQAATNTNGAATYLQAEGQAVSSLRDHDAAAKAIGAIGQFAAAIHAVDVTDGVDLPTRTIDEELALVARASEHLVFLAPELAEKVAQVLSEVGRLMGDDAPCQLVHGDLKLDHIFASSNGVQLIDLDGFRFADPASDLAKLRAELRYLRLGQKRPAIGLSARHLLDEYALTGEAEVVERARLLEPALLIKMAARRISVVDRTWRRQVTAIVEEAFRLSVASTERSAA